MKTTRLLSLAAAFGLTLAVIGCADNNENAAGKGGTSSNTAPGQNVSDAPKNAMDYNKRMATGGAMPGASRTNLDQYKKSGMGGGGGPR